MTKEIYHDMWGWKVFKHSTGNLKFSVYDGDTEVCWCRSEEQAKKIILALKKAAFA